MSQISYSNSSFENQIETIPILQYTALPNRLEMRCFQPELMNHGSK
jgi:hypothetical protein